MYTIKYNYILSKKGILNSKMLSRKDSTQQYNNKRINKKEIL